MNLKGRQGGSWGCKELSRKLHICMPRLCSRLATIFWVLGLFLSLVYLAFLSLLF